MEGNLERALSEEQRPGAERKLTGKEEALLVATACASPPAGRAREQFGVERICQNSVGELIWFVLIPPSPGL